MTSLPKRASSCLRYAKRRRKTPTRFALAALLASALFLGCKSKHTPSPAPALAQTVAPAPVQHTAPPAAFKLFHKTDNSLTLVTDEHATNDQLAALLLQLHEAARDHTFDALGLPQKFIDARDPIIWFHIYRGSKCASEKYAATLPCAASYHASADYTLGSFTNPNHDDGVLIQDEAHETHLWAND